MLILNREIQPLSLHSVWQQIQPFTMKLITETGKINQEKDSVPEQQIFSKKSCSSVEEQAGNEVFSLPRSSSISDS